MANDTTADRVYNFSAGPAVLPLAVSGTGATRIAGTSRLRRFGHGNQSSQQAFHRGLGRSESRLGEAAESVRTTMTSCSCRVVLGCSSPWSR